MKMYGKGLLLILFLTIAQSLGSSVQTAYINNQQAIPPGAGVTLPGKPKPQSSVQQGVGQQAAITRHFDIELREDDTVAITDHFTNLPYYSFWTYYGPTDVEWLNLSGGTNYVKNGSDVTFYNVQGDLTVTYRSKQFSNRQSDEVTFGAGPWATDPFDVYINVYFPSWYQLTSATPSGYVANTGNLRWTFFNITSVTIEAYFNQTGGQRPQLDLPVDYKGRNESLGTEFARAFNTRTTVLFDHRFPNYTYDQKLLPYTGEEVPNPGGSGDCNLGKNCYDGHDAYDFDDRCPAQSPCTNRVAVYPAADGVIIQAGWLDDKLGCQIVIDHGNEWKTRYAHLQDLHKNHTCTGILRWTGPVNRFVQIGIIGESGSGADGTHLHFVVRHNSVVVDPSGWEPNPQIFRDPWEKKSGEVSYPMWMNAIRTTRIAPLQTSTNIPSQYYDVMVNVPPWYYSSELVFTLAEFPVLHIPDTLISTGHSFSLNAVDNTNNFIHQLDQNLTITIDFNNEELQGIQSNTLSLYTWNNPSSSWVAIPTSINLSGKVATTQIDHLSLFALMGTKIYKTYLPLITK
ncbi:MAG: M23 family metallopeptidase [Anaerolineae bacterium]|nr:M23 family metallopeptidase [Anaerolineae bacterium]